jgi:hypothetical protein
LFHSSPPGGLLSRPQTAYLVGYRLSTEAAIEALSSSSLVSTTFPTDITAKPPVVEPLLPRRCTTAPADVVGR